jgi:hypothetical protein
MKPRFLVAATVAAMLFTAGCSSLATILEAVMIATAAAPGAVVALEAAGTITSAMGNQILDFASTVNEDASKALTEAQSTDAPAQMAAVIAADFSNLPQVIPGLPPAAAAIIGGIQAAVEAVLAAVGAPNPSSTAGPATARTAPTVNVKKLPERAYKISTAKARELRAKIEATRAAIAKARQGNHALLQRP